MVVPNYAFKWTAGSEFGTFWNVVGPRPLPDPCCQLPELGGS